MKELQPRWQEATNELISKLEMCDIKFESFNAIELFGREGDWQTKLFAKKVKSFEVWEINPEYEAQLKNNLPNSIVKIIDSIHMLQENTNFQKFDLILMDNPNNTYGPRTDEDNVGKYCEHFDIIQNIRKLIGEKALVIFNVNRKPFNYSKFPSWKKRRDKFYGNRNTDDMLIDELLTFYEDLFKKMGFETIFNLNVVRVLYDGIDTNHYFAFMLTRTNKI